MSESQLTLKYFGERIAVAFMEWLTDIGQLRRGSFSSFLVM